jgi:predicted nucleic acid-binding protein
MAYLDTSVVVAYYCPEALSAAVGKAFARIPTPAISPLTEVEVRSGLALKIRTGQISAADASKILAQFSVHLSDGFYRIVEVGPREFELARDWIGLFTTPLRTLDALHLACAFANGLPILTADKSLSNSARSLGVVCKLIHA